MISKSRLKKHFQVFVFVLFVQFWLEQVQFMADWVQAHWRWSYWILSSLGEQTFGKSGRLRKNREKQYRRRFHIRWSFVPSSIQRDTYCYGEFCIFAVVFRSVISTSSWGGGKFFLFFNATGLLKNWKKQHFICSNLTLFIVPFFLSFFFSLFFLFFFLFFFFSFSWRGVTAPQPPQMSNNAPGWLGNPQFDKNVCLSEFSRYTSDMLNMWLCPISQDSLTSEAAAVTLYVQIKIKKMVTNEECSTICRQFRTRI